MNFTLDKADLKTSLQGSAPDSDLSPGKRPGLRPRLDGLVAGVAPLPADQVGEEHDEDQPRQGAAHSDGDQHAVLVQPALLHCREDRWTAGSPCRAHGSRGEASPALLRGWWEHRGRAGPAESGTQAEDAGALLLTGPYSPGPNLSPSTRNACSHTRNMLREKLLVTRRRCSALHLYEFPAVACSALSELLVAVKLPSAKAEG